MGGDTSGNMPKSSTYPVLADRPKGKQIHGIYKDRLRQFTSGGQYQSESLLS
jgi:alpha-mannosidase